MLPHLSSEQANIRTGKVRGGFDSRPRHHSQPFLLLKAALFPNLVHTRMFARDEGKDEGLKFIPLFFRSRLPDRKVRVSQ